MKKAYCNVKSIGMDVHKKFSQVCMRDAKQEIVRQERLDHGDRRRLRERIGAWPKDAVVVMESTFGWPWLADEMVAAGLTVQLSNCFKVKKMAEARGMPHNNKVDARLQSLLPSEAGDWWKVWMPPPEVRDDRIWVRYREDLVDVNVQLRNRIHAVMHQYGILPGFTDLFGVQGRAFLKALCVTGRTGEVALRPGALEALRGLMSLWQKVRDQLAAAERRLRSSLKHNALTRRLDTLPGVGLVLSHVLAAEIGRMERFGSEAALSSYALVVPRDHTTGEAAGAPVGQHVGTHGNLRLKWALIEAAHGAKRKDPRLRRIYDHYTQGGKFRRQQGLIRVAHELCRLIYRMWTRGEDYRAGAPPVPVSTVLDSAAGHKTPRQRMDEWMQSRSVVGQPSTAMAAACGTRQASL